MQSACHVLGARQELLVTYGRRRPRKAGASQMPRDNTKRRGNYDSGEDYVLEYGELRFTFNEEDFRQRVEQAAVKLNFVDPGLGQDELEDQVVPPVVDVLPER